ncbi:MAG TPA: redoxin family protein [Flavobacterium sp.]|uniref:redoxin family protein n=1 Tax=Flavobacterium sp. TaxID=239 RepID=UPI002C7980EA|nr:redoxin family protein [Flavobacterium sp.]HSD15318.1 redoxin family protein [Flavobacterium sp.]
MKTNISNFITVLKAENIKRRGTMLYWSSAILGIISPLLFFTILLSRPDEGIKSQLPFNFYMKFIDNTLEPFANFFLPLLIIITASRITQLDHKNGGWQLMETQPAQKFSIYFSKFLTILTATLISIVSFTIVGILLAWISHFIIDVPKMAIMEFPFVEILHTVSRLFMASLLITALQFTLSVLIPSFIWSILIGFFGLLLTLFLQPFNLIPDWYPYEILSKIASKSEGSDLGYWFTFTDYLSLSISIILLYIGFRWYQHKTFRLAFIKTPKMTGLAIVTVFGGLTCWLLCSNQMPDHDKTVFCGKIESKEQFQNIYLRDLTLDDTIAVIPIKNNEFHYIFKNNVITDNYEFIIDGKYHGNVFFGKKDSIYIDGKTAESASEFKLKGTRLAENQMSSDPKMEWSMVTYYLEQNINLDQPQIIIDALYDGWKEAMEASNTFKTVDNYIPKNDYTERKQKLVTTHYLNLWNNFLKKRAALYPNEKTTGGKSIAEIQSKLSLTDESLLSSSEYFDLVKNQLIAKDHRDIDEDTKAIMAISKLKNGSFKDKMLFWQIKKVIEESSTSAERNQFVAKYNPLIANTYYQQKINNFNRIAESLGKGKTAPSFEATSLDGKKVSLAGLKGKYVLIDVWATWCGPCRQQSPFFEKFALKYKKENIQFVALNSDTNLQDWFIDAKSKSKTVLQWHLDDSKQFANNYNLEYIPRFILIDPNGNFVNAKLPFPNDASFEILLRKALHLPDEG